MEKEIFNKMAAAANMLIQDINDSNLFRKIKASKDLIIYSDNQSKLLERILTNFENEIPKKPDNPKEVVLINVTSNEIIEINSHYIEESRLINIPFRKNYKKGEITIDELGRANENVEIIEEQRLVVIQNFDNLSEATQRSMLVDVVDSYPKGHSIILDELGFIRTKSDQLIMIVDISEGKPQMSKNVAPRCSQCFIYSG